MDEKAVWQRVAAQGAPLDIGRRLEEEWMDSVLYLHLSKQFSGREQRLLYGMFQQEQAHIACLRGICAINTGSLPKMQVPAVPKETVQELLRRSYGREMRCLAAYESRKADPAYGPVFTHLAAQEQEHCATVLQIFGK